MVYCPGKEGVPNGQICLVDSQIVFEKSGPNVAIQTARSLYLNNVYIKGAATLATHKDGARLDGNASGWRHVREYAHGIRSAPIQAKGKGSTTAKTLVYDAPVYLDGNRQTQDIVEIAGNDAPPVGIEQRHLWDSSFPSWETQEAVNVKAPPYNARGDGETDDAAAIQRAIDENTVVFLPVGVYRVSRTIKLRPNTALVGMTRHLSVIKAKESGDFADPKSPRPVIQTANDADAKTCLALLKIEVPGPGAYGLLWQCGRHSVYNCVNVKNRFKGKPNQIMPMVVISGNGGGKWYEFFETSSDSRAKSYRHILVDGTSQPLSFYQISPEHSRGEANMEIRNSKHVSLYGLKAEGNLPILVVRDSDHIRMFGYGGNAAAFPGTSLFRICNTPNCALANLVDTPQLAGPDDANPDRFSGMGVDPDQWHMIIEEDSGNGTVKTAPMDAPVLYRRGAPVAGS